MARLFSMALIVNLTTQTAEISRLPGEWSRDFIGGEGLGTRLLYDLAEADDEPFSPLQPLIFVTGPLTGTAAPSSDRCALLFRSPLTGRMEAAGTGGTFAPAPKRAGHDVLVVTGRAETPIVLAVDGEEIHFLRAAHLWGKGTIATKEHLQGELGRSGWHVVSIGPAGERGVLFSSIMTGWRSFGPGGAGALMGDKNLKALAIRGTREAPSAKDERFRERALSATEELLRDLFVRDGVSPLPIPSFQETLTALGLLAGRPDRYGRLADPARQERGKSAAPPGVIGWERQEAKPLPSGRAEGEALTDREAALAFGEGCGVRDREAVAGATKLAVDLGLDIYATGAAVASAMTWAERGLLGDEDLSGPPLTYGDGESLLRLVSMIGRREGLGDLFASGIAKAAARLGEKAFEAEMGPIGAEEDDSYPGCRDEALVFSAVEALGKAGAKGVGLRALLARAMIPNLLGLSLCAGAAATLNPATWAELLSLTWGRKVTAEELLLAGERTIALERLLDGSFAIFPSRPEGPRDGGPGARKRPEEYDDTLLDRFYEALGWNGDNGLPSPETLKRLGLDWALS